MSTKARNIFEDGFKNLTDNLSTKKPKKIYNNQGIHKELIESSQRNSSLFTINRKKTKSKHLTSYGKLFYSSSGNNKNRKKIKGMKELKKLYNMFKAKKLPISKVKARIKYPANFKKLIDPKLKRSKNIFKRGLDKIKIGSSTTKKLYYANQGYGMSWSKRYGVEADKAGQDESNTGSGGSL